MRTIEVKLFQFEELSDAAKEKARDWYREGNPDDLLDNMLESFETAAKLLGITFETRSIPLMNGGTRTESKILYSGFSSQGDGASFEGRYEFTKGCSKAIRKEFPEDKALHRIANGLTVLHTRYLLAHGTSLVARITQSDNHYVHKYTMDVDVNEADGETGINEENANEFRELMRDFAQWIYDALEAEYNYQNSDEAVDDSITANEYEFEEDGTRA